MSREPREAGGEVLRRGRVDDGDEDAEEVLREQVTGVPEERGEEHLAPEPLLQGRQQLLQCWTRDQERPRPTSIFWPGFENPFCRYEDSNRFKTCGSYSNGPCYTIQVLSRYGAHYC